MLAPDSGSDTKENSQSSVSEIDTSEDDNFSDSQEEQDTQTDVTSTSISGKRGTDAGDSAGLLSKHHVYQDYMLNNCLLLFQMMNHQKKESKWVSQHQHTLTHHHRAITTIILQHKNHFNISLHHNLQLIKDIMHKKIVADLHQAAHQLILIVQMIVHIIQPKVTKNNVKKAEDHVKSPEMHPVADENHIEEVTDHIEIVVIVNQHQKEATTVDQEVDQLADQEVDPVADQEVDPGVDREVCQGEDLDPEVDPEVHHEADHQLAVEIAINTIVTEVEYIMIHDVNEKVIDMAENLADLNQMMIFE